jgi:hypothetical protein
MSAADRVALGAALLDQQSPDWWRRVDLGELATDSCSHCVLGQLYGWYYTGLDRLGLKDDERVTYGFSERRWERWDPENYRVLDEAWVREIAHRRQWDAERAELRALRAAEGLDPLCGCDEQAGRP